MTLRVAVVGLGFMGVTHLDAWGRVSGAEVGAVVSGDARKLQGDLDSVGGNLPGKRERQDFSRFKKYTDLEFALEDKEIDAVDLCVPTCLHLPLAKRAMAAGKHVLVEKPMALDAAQCDQLLEAWAASGKVLMVAHVLRFWPEYVALRSIVEAGRLGRIHHALFRRACGAPRWSPWMRDPAQSGGGAFDLLIHDLDLAIHLWGRPRVVKAAGAWAAAGAIDLLNAEVGFSESVKVLVEGGWTNGDLPFEQGYRVAGSEGVVAFDSAGGRVCLYPASGGVEQVAVEGTAAFESQLSAFALACLEGSPPVMCHPEESANSVRWMRAALESRRTGRPERM